MLDVEKGRGAWRRGAGGEGGRPGRCRHPEQPGGSDRGDPWSSRDPVPRADGRAQAPGRRPVLRIGVHRWVVLGVPAAGGVRTAHLGAGLHPPTQMQWPPRSLHVLTAHLGSWLWRDWLSSAFSPGKQVCGSGQPHFVAEGRGTVIVLGTGAGPGAPRTAPGLGGACPLPASASPGTVPDFLPRPAGR